MHSIHFHALFLSGRFHYEIQYDAGFATQNLDLYYDTPTQWARVYGRKSNLRTCQERESVLQVSLMKREI